MPLASVTEYVLTWATVFAIGYYFLRIAAATKFYLGRKESPAAEALPPVSIMVPLHGADFHAYDNYAVLCRQDYPSYQIVFGVHDAADPAVALVRRLEEEFPEADIELVICPKTAGRNLKIGNLHNMLPRTRYERIVIVDSDIRVREDYLRSVIPPLADEKVGLVTCMYRGRDAFGFASRLEAIGLTSDFAPNVFVAWLLEGVRFAFGSTMAMSKSMLESIGGFSAIADYLADDYMLGLLTAKRGRRVELSPYVVETVLGRIEFPRMLKHQIRWARSTRMSRPLGYLGLILSHGIPLSLLCCLASGASALSLILAATALGVRMVQAWLVGCYWLGDRVLLKNLWLVPASDILGFLVWIASFAGREVEWRGRLLKIGEGGRILPLYDSAEVRSRAAAEVVRGMR